MKKDVSNKREGRKCLCNDTLNTFYLQLYGVGQMVKDHVYIYGALAGTRNSSIHLTMRERSYTGIYISLHNKSGKRRK